MHWRLKAISVFLCFTLISLSAAGCGGKSVKATVTAAQGGTATLDNFKVTVPPGALSTDTKVSIANVSKLPKFTEDISKEEQETLSSVCKFIGPVYELDLGEGLSKPVTVSFGYDDSDIPSGLTTDDLAVVHFQDGKWDILESTVDPANKTVSAEITSASPYGLIVIGGLALLFLAGALYWCILAKPEYSGIAWKYLSPQASNVQGKVKSGDFIVDVAGKQLVLKGVEYFPYLRGRVVPPKTGEQMLKKAEGMCGDFSNLFGSLLIAAGYPVRVVGGEATYNVEGKEIKGGHAWVEVVIEGQMYYVDTFDPKKAITLIPIAEARQKLKLKMGQMWGRTKDGKQIASAPYDKMWPLLGEWKLERKGITPKPPFDDMLINPIIPASATWKISRGNDSKLAIDYGGKIEWFTTIGQVTPGVKLYEETENALSCTLDRDGRMFIEKLPIILSFILKPINRAEPENKGMEEITFNYEYWITLSLTKENKLAVAITGDARGSYVGIREEIDPETGAKKDVRVPRTFTFSGGTVTYEATKKE